MNLRMSHQDNYDPEHENEDEFDVNSNRKKKGILINVKKEGN